MQNLTRLSLLAALAACTETTPPGPTEITITMDVPPDFIAARDDADGRWLAPAALDAKTFTFAATGPYRVTIGCRVGTDLAALFQLARTLDDEAALDVQCGPKPFAPITTTMVQPGTVAVENYSLTSSDPDWEVSLDSSPGRHTVAAYDATRMLIVRDVEVAPGGSAMPPLDLTGGFDLVTGALTAANATEDEAVTAVVMLELGDTTLFLHEGRAEEARFVPEGALSRSEHQYVQVSANRAGKSRYTVSERPGAALVTLPPPMTSATLTASGHDVTAAWQASLLGRVGVQAIAFSPNGDGVWLHQLTASASYAATLGATATIELDAIPDLPSSLLFDLAAPHSRAVYVDTEVSGGETQGVSWTEYFNSPDAVRRPRLAKPIR